MDEIETGLTNTERENSRLQRLLEEANSITIPSTDQKDSKTRSQEGIGKTCVPKDLMSARRFAMNSHTPFLRRARLRLNEMIICENLLFTSLQQYFFTSLSHLPLKPLSLHQRFFTQLALITVARHVWVTPAIEDTVTDEVFDVNAAKV